MLMSSSNLISNALTIISGIIVAKWLLPDELGLYNGFTLISSYIILTQLGIPSGLSRELPFQIGQGNTKEAESLAGTAHYWQLILSLIVLVASSIIAVTCLVQKRYEYAAGLMVVGLLSFQALYITKYLKVLFRTNHDFNLLSRITFINGIVAFASIVFVWKFGFFGLCIRAFILVVVDFALTWYWKPMHVLPVWRKEAYRKLSSVGLPMYAIANVYALWPVLQKTLIVSLGGVKFLGLFALAVVIESGMKTVTNSISSVVYPSLTMQWAKGDSVRILTKTMLKPVSVIFILFAVAVPIGWVVLPQAIVQFLPQYEAGIAAAQWMLVVGFIEVFNVLPVVYNVIQKQRDRLLSFLAGVSAWTIAVIGLVQIRGFELVVFPQAMLIGFLVMLIMNSIHLYRYRDLTVNAEAT
jgi:O-antigen/teichoic acid export membrane protein